MHINVHNVTRIFGNVPDNINVGPEYDRIFDHVLDNANICPEYDQDF